MNAETTISRIGDVLGGKLKGYHRKSGRRVYLDIGPESVLETGRLMFRDIGARLQIATGVDTLDGIEMMYHWALDTEDCLVTVRVTLPHQKPQLDSIAGVCPAAEWIEREMWELLGIEFVEHPDLRHLLLDDDWPEGNYPLRKYSAGLGERP